MVKDEKKYDEPEVKASSKVPGAGMVATQELPRLNLNAGQKFNGKIPDGLQTKRETAGFKPPADEAELLKLATDYVRRGWLVPETVWKEKFLPKIQKARELVRGKR